MKLRLVALLLFVASSLSAQTSIRLGDAVEPVSQQVALRLDPEADAYAASTTIDVNVRKSVREVRLHSLGPVIESVTIDGKRATFETGEQAILTITNGELLDVGRHRIAISFRNDYDRQALGLYKVVKDGQPSLF